METLVVGRDLSFDELADDLVLCSDRGDVVGLDTETMGIDPTKQASACGDGEIACWSVSTPAYPRVFLWADQLIHFKPWLESDTHLKCGHNIYGFDYHMFAQHDIKLGGIAGDTRRMSRLIYSCKTRSHGLKDLAKNWLNIEQPSYKSLFMRPKHSIEFCQEKRKVKGSVELLDERETKRKVGEHTKVPTLLVTGERGKFGKALEFIPLTDIPDLYPGRLEALYDYASLDAQLTRLLFIEFERKLKGTIWEIRK